MNCSFPAATITLAALVVTACLTGCETMSHTDPRFTALEPYAEANPAPDAIVGMWQREKEGELSGSAVSVLFRKNGYGMLKQSRVHPDGYPIALEPVRFTYQYSGNGVWHDPVGNTYRLAKGYLLRNVRQIPKSSEETVNANIKDVLTRVE